MSTKNYYYISQTKIEMLEPQLAPRFSMPEISPTVELTGLRVGAKIGPTAQNENRVRRLISLLRKMRSRGLLRVLDDTDSLESNVYYTDTLEWYSGLFAFVGALGLGDEPVRVISYLLWRPWNETILLLAGSPQHILGEKIVRQGISIYGTTGTWSSMLSFASQSLETGEPNLVYTGPHRQDRPTGEEALSWVEMDATELDGSEEDLPPELPACSDALGLGLTCVRYFSRLPKNRLELVFTPYRRLNFKRRADLPHWAFELLNTPTLDPNLVDFFWKCRAIYIGSPLYTALA